MPRILKLNNYGTLGVTIPKALTRSIDLKAGDHVEVKVKSIDPLILAIVKPKKIEW